MKATITHAGLFKFETQIRDHKFFQDTQVAQGGTNTGPTPKELLLAGVIGCAGMDVVSILAKHKMNADSLKIYADAETRKEHPRIFQGITIVFEATGQNLGAREFVEAVHASLTLYCGVTAMVSKVVPVHYKVQLNGQIEGEGEAKFNL